MLVTVSVGAEPVLVATTATDVTADDSVRAAGCKRLAYMAFCEADDDEPDVPPTRSGSDE